MVRSKRCGLVGLDVDEEEAGRAAGQAVVHLRRDGAVEQDDGGKQGQAQAQRRDHARRSPRPGRVRLASASRSSGERGRGSLRSATRNAFRRAAAAATSSTSGAAQKLAAQTAARAPSTSVSADDDQAPATAGRQRDRAGGRAHCGGATSVAEQAGGRNRRARGQRRHGKGDGRQQSERGRQQQRGGIECQMSAAAAGRRHRNMRRANGSGAPSAQPSSDRQQRDRHHLQKEDQKDQSRRPRPAISGWRSRALAVEEGATPPGRRRRRRRPAPSVPPRSGTS